MSIFEELSQLITAARNQDGTVTITIRTPAGSGIQINNAATLKNVAGSLSEAGDVVSITFAAPAAPAAEWVQVTTFQPDPLVNAVISLMSVVFGENFKAENNAVFAKAPVVDSVKLLLKTVYEAAFAAMVNK